MSRVTDTSTSDVTSNRYCNYCRFSFQKILPNWPNISGKSRWLNYDKNSNLENLRNFLRPGWQVLVVGLSGGPTVNREQQGFVILVHDILKRHEDMNS